MSENSVVIVGSARTPIGDLLGVYSNMSAIELGSHAIKAAIERAKISPKDIEEAIMGCVLPAGLGQAPARQASLMAGIPNSVPCSTINKVCGSGMKAVMNATDAILLGTRQIMVAGGMESMTNAPYLLDKARAGYRLGHGQIKDAMLLDGLEDAYEKGTSMGVFAERTAEKYHFTREAQDEFSMTSLKRAQVATEKGWFLTDVEIVPIEVKPAKGEPLKVDKDEHPQKVKAEKIPTLKPAFKKDGTVTPGNSSSISDGGATLVLMNEKEAEKRGLKPIAKILGHSSFSKEPAWFTTAPISAIQSLLKKLNWTIESVDLFEVNEAFACVAMAAMKDLNIPHDKLNVHGGACALGHPIGASGTRIICTLLGALKQQNKKRGIASLCIGGGEATALGVELIP
jgi:acetyl-CoA C-acetyltransferase